MALRTYTTHPGENIFDVAITLFGSIEGIFNLLLRNKNNIDGGPLTVNTVLSKGMVLNYDDDFIVNQDIVNWLSNNHTKVRNGHHVLRVTIISNIFRDYIYIYNQQLRDEAANNPDNKDVILAKMIPEDDEAMELMKSVRAIIRHKGDMCILSCALEETTLLAIDWGDGSEIAIYDPTDGQMEIEHDYNDEDEHIIRIYGNCKFQNLDLTHIDGILYPTSRIEISGRFVPNVNNEQLNNLIKHRFILNISHLNGDDKIL